MPCILLRGTGGRACITLAWRDLYGSGLPQSRERMLELLPSHRQARFGDLDYDWEHSVNTTRSNVGFYTQLRAGLLGGAYYASDPWIFEQIMQQLALSTQHSVISKEPSVAGHESPDYAGLKNFTFIDFTFIDLAPERPRTADGL